MHCRNCGKEIDSNDDFCPNCGSTVDADTDVSSNTQHNQTQHHHGEVDAPNIGFAILSAFIPIVGIILFFVWKDKQPLKAKSCLQGFLVGIVLNIVLICCAMSAMPRSYNFYTILKVGL